MSWRVSVGCIVKGSVGTPASVNAGLLVGVKPSAETLIGTPPLTRRTSWAVAATPSARVPKPTCRFMPAGSVSSQLSPPLVSWQICSAVVTPVPSSRMVNCVGAELELVASVTVPFASPSRTGEKVTLRLVVAPGATVSIAPGAKATVNSASLEVTRTGVTESGSLPPLSTVMGSVLAAPSPTDPNCSVREPSLAAIGVTSACGPTDCRAFEWQWQEENARQAASRYEGYARGMAPHQSCRSATAAVGRAADGEPELECLAALLKRTPLVILQ